MVRPFSSCLNFTLPSDHFQVSYINVCGHRVNQECLNRVGLLWCQLDTCTASARNMFAQSHPQCEASRAKQLALTCLPAFNKSLPLIMLMEMDITQCSKQKNCQSAQLCSPDISTTLKWGNSTDCLCSFPKLSSFPSINTSPSLCLWLISRAMK